MTLKLVMIRCPDNVALERREVSGGEFSIGRGPDNQWVVADPDRHLSKRHCRFVYAIGGYDGMHLIYEVLKKTGGKTDSDAVVAAMKGMKWESPRGPMSIDPETRDVVHNEYIRKVERVNGQLYNVEFATVEAVKDPTKAAKK